MNSLTDRLTDTANPLRIHLIGVAGSGMSGLALLLLGMGHKVSGSRSFFRLGLEPLVVFP